MHNINRLFHHQSKPAEDNSRTIEHPVDSLHEVLPLFDFCVVDLETTGMNPYAGAEIIEIGAVRIENGELSGTFQQLIEPHRSIPANITELTGITNDMVAGKPTVHDVLPEFVEFLDDAILLAHNFTFDFSFLDRYHSDNFFNEYICTVKLARNVADYRSNALDYLNEHLELNRNEAHRALDDAVATGKLFQILSRNVTDPTDFHSGGLPACLHQMNPGALVMNIPGVGAAKGRAIDRHLNTTEHLIEASQDELEQVSGIGPKLAEKIRQFTRSFSPIQPVRDEPVKLNRSRRDEYNQHHRDEVPEPDDFIRQDSK